MLRIRPTIIPFVVLSVLMVLWAMLMVVFGLLLITEWHDRQLLSDRNAKLVGVALVGAGQFVFGAFVAGSRPGLGERFFPHASRGVTDGYLLLSWAVLMAPCLILLARVTGVLA